MHLLPALSSKRALEALAPAKLNLFLHITGKRTDGYHLLESLFVFTELGDRLTVTPSESHDITFEITGDYAVLLTNTPPEENLVYRAALALRPYASSPCGVTIRLEKNLPIASGLGGGSSDAATAFRLFSELWGIPVSDQAELLPKLALKLGADVPSCLNPTPCLVTGIGEEIMPLEAFPALPVVLVNPNIPLSAGDVYRAYSNPLLRAERSNPDTSQMAQLWIASLSSTPRNDVSLLEHLRKMKNDLQPPAISLVPMIGDVLAAIEKTGCAFSQMSGSGATCFGIYDTVEQAQSAAHSLASAYPGWWVRATRVVGS